MNLDKKDVEIIIPLLNIQPRNTKVIITLNKVNEESDLILSDNIMSDEQYVLAKGSFVRDLEVGQKVKIDLERMMVKEINPENQHEYLYRVKIDPIEFNGYTFAIIDDNYIKAFYK